MGKNALVVAVIVVCLGACKKGQSAECRDKAEALLSSTAQLAEKTCACATLACVAQAMAENQAVIDATSGQCSEGLADETRPVTRANMDRALACAKKLQ